MKFIEPAFQGVCIFGGDRGDLSQSWKQLHLEEHCHFLSWPDIVEEIMSRKLIKTENRTYV
jgi:hypothetical protein